MSNSDKIEADDGIGSFTLDEYFSRHRISRSRGYKEIQAGRLETVYFGESRRITKHQARKHQALLEAEAEQRALAGEKPRPRGRQLTMKQNMEAA
jgi:hypothetical protein